MKRLALIVALALIISIGGVYATWRYSTQTVQPFEYNISNKLSITQVAATNNVKGSISAPLNITLTIDDDNSDHKPDRDADIDVSAEQLDIKFTPNTSASSTTFKYYLTVDNFSYECDQHGAEPTTINIFNPVDLDDDIPGAQLFIGTLEYDGGPEAVSLATPYTTEQIQGLLNLNKEVLLDSIDKYGHYSEGVNNVTLILHVEEVTP